MTKNVLILHDEVGANIAEYLQLYFPRIVTFAHTRIDNFLDSARATSVDAAVVELLSDYRDLSGVRDKIDNPLDLFPILKNLGVENSIAHVAVYLGPEQELAAREAGASDFVAKKWSVGKKNSIYSKYLL